MYVSFVQTGVETIIEGFLNMKVAVQVKLGRQKLCDWLKWIKTNYKFIFYPTLYRNAQLKPLVSRIAHLFQLRHIFLFLFWSRQIWRRNWRPWEIAVVVCEIKKWPINSRWIKQLHSVKMLKANLLQNGEPQKYWKK